MTFDPSTPEPLDPYAEAHGSFSRGPGPTVPLARRRYVRYVPPAPRPTGPSPTMARLKNALRQAASADRDPQTASPIRKDYTMSRPQDYRGPKEALDLYAAKYANQPSYGDQLPQTDNLPTQGSRPGTVHTSLPHSGRCGINRYWLAKGGVPR